MDFENSLLEDWDNGIPTGPRRFEEAEWAELVKRNVYPNHSDVDWDEYVDWVSSGGGDGLFVDSVEGEEMCVALLRRLQRFREEWSSI